MNRKIQEKKQGRFKPSLLILGIFFVFFFILIVQNKAQAINQQITFQGKLTDASGNNLAGTYYLKFTIYDSLTDGSCQYTGAGSCGSVTTTPVALTNGLFSVNLGDTTNDLNALPASLFNSDALYLGLTVCSAPNTGCDSEMTPRKRITASPYSFNSDRLSGLATSTQGGDSSYIPATDSSGNLKISNSFYAATSTSGQLGFGTSTVPGGVKVFLDSTSAADKLLVLRANSSQTGNLQEWQNNAGTALVSIGSSGNTSISGTLQVSSTSTLATTTLSGYLGIGIAAPLSALDVVGNINYTGLLKISNGTILSQTTGSNSLAVGLNAGHSSSGSNNTFLGFQAGTYTTTGDDNVFLGNDAGRYNETGYQNVFIGENSGRANTSGHDNTFLGLGSGQLHTIGYYNTFIGELSGGNNISGQANVFLGYSAGFNETGSNKLYIANSNTASPLIYGEFNNQLLRVNGNVQATGTLKLSNGSTTSTLANNSLILAQDSSNALGKFYVDSSGNLSASGTLGIFGNTSLQGSLAVTSNTSSLRSLLLSSLTSAPDVQAGTVYFNSADGKFYGYTSAGTAVDLGATGGGTNDWGRFGTTYGASALMTSSTYPVWFDGAVYASSSIKVAGGGNSYIDVGGEGNGLAQLYIKATSTIANPLIIRGVANQTSNLTEWQYSNGNIIASIASSSDAGDFPFTDFSLLDLGYRNSASDERRGIINLWGSGLLTIRGDTDNPSGGNIITYLSPDQLNFGSWDALSTSTYAQDSISLMKQAGYNQGKFYVDSSGNLSASGTLAVIGATTLTGALTANGNVTLGNAASDLVTLGGYFDVTTVGNLTATSTLGSNYLQVGAVAADVLGKFYVDSSGNTSASGTLAVIGATTLTGALTANGNVTLGNAVTDNITANGFVISDLIIYDTLGNKLIDIGNGITTSTFEKNSLTLGKTSGYDLGTFDVDDTGSISASGTLNIFGNTTLQGSLSATSNTSSLRSLLLSSLTSAPDVQAGTVYFNSADGKFYGYTSAGTAVDLGATGGGTNDWGRFGTTYGASALMTSSTYPVWFDGAVYASSTFTATGNSVFLGNVGMGSSTPASKLSILGTASGANSLVYLHNNSGGGGGTTLYATNDSGNSGSLATFINKGTGAALTVTNNSTGYAALFTSGNIGVGTTTPQAKIHLTGGTLLQTIESAPTIASSTVLSNAGGILNPVSIDISRNYAYIQGNLSLTIYNVSQPSSPVKVTSTSILDPRAGCFSSNGQLKVVGKYAYNVDHDNAYFCVTDVSNPYGPSIVAQISDGTALPDPSGLYVSGKYAYVVSGTNKRFAVVDISNPLNPVVLTSITDASNLAGALGVYVVGKYAYVAAEQKLTVIDVSNPKNVSIVGTLSSGHLAGSQGLYVSGSYAYVVTDNTSYSKFVVVNVSNPLAPTQTTSFNVSTSVIGYSVYVSGKYAYVALNGSLAVVNIADPTAPYKVTTLTNSSLSTSGSGWYHRNVVSGKYNYSVAYTSGNAYLTIVDLTGIDAPGGNIGNVSASGMTVNENMEIGNNLYVRSGLNIGDGGLMLNGDFAMSGATTNTLSFSTSTLFTNTTPDYSGNRAFIFDATNFSVYNNDRYIFSLRSNNSKVFSVTSNGDVRASGTLYALSNTVGTPGAPGDLSERVDILNGENVEPGDVMILSTSTIDTYQTSKGAYAKTVAGVVSTNPTIVIGNGKTEYTAAVAMIGRVPVKVVAENGPIEIGDYLVTASKPGYAMKYDIASGKTAAIIGVALEPLEGEEGKILSLVNSSLAPGSGSAKSSDLNISPTNDNQLVMDSDLDFNGFSIFNLKSLRGKDNKWYIDEEGNLMAESIKSNKVQTKELIMEKDTANNYSTVGEGTIKSGENFVEITNAAIKKDSKIFVTFRGNPGSFWWIADQENGKFKIMLSTSAGSDTTFDYWLMGVLDNSGSSSNNTDSGNNNTIPSDNSSSPSENQSDTPTVETEESEIPSVTNPASEETTTINDNNNETPDSDSSGNSASSSDDTSDAGQTNAPVINEPPAEQPPTLEAPPPPPTVEAPPPAQDSGTGETATN